MRTNTDIKNLTEGPVARKLYFFALPIICTNLLQAVYSLVDMIIVGRVLGSVGITSVNVGGQVVLVVFMAINAYANAEAVLVGQLIGADNKKEISKVVNTVLVFSLILATILIVGIIAFSTPLLHLMNVPEEAFESTRTYMIVYMCGTYFVYIYNALYGLLRGLGNSTTPMIFAAVSTGTNILLDYLFVAVMHLGTGGAAFATILSQALGMILMIVYVQRKVSVYHFQLKQLRIARNWLRESLRVGLPQMFQFCLSGISFLMISALINSYGVVAAAAVGAVNKIYTFAVLPGQAMMASILTMTAQNLPGKNYVRIRRGLCFGVLLSGLIGLAVFALCQIFPGQILSVFTSETDVIDMGIYFMHVFIWCVLVENVMFCFNGHLTGAGYTHITMTAALISAFLIRFGFAYLLSRATPLGFIGIAYAYIIAPSFQLAVGFFFSLSGRWKKPRVRLQDNDNL